MCIYHAVLLLDYTITGQDGQLLVTDAESLPIPEFDNIGMESSCSVFCEYIVDIAFIRELLLRERICFV